MLFIEKIGNFSNYSTAYTDTEEGYTCNYCLSNHLIIDDSFDEHGNFLGARYYCTCEKALEEQAFKRKLELEPLTSNSLVLNPHPKLKELKIIDTFVGLIQANPEISLDDFQQMLKKAYEN